MTAETLKPFITPTGAVNNFPAKQSGVTHSKRSSRQLLVIVLGVVALLLVAGILTLTIWQTIRVGQLDNDLGSMRRELDSLRQRLGLNYLDEIAEFQKEYTDLLNHDPNKLNDLEGEEDDEDDDLDDDEDGDGDGDGWFTGSNVDDDEDDDDDEDKANERTDYDEYLDLVQKEKEEAATTPQSTGEKWETAASASTSAASNDDNVFDDFTSYNDAKKKKERFRSTRSIAELRNELQSNDLPQIPKSQKQNETEEQSKDTTVSANSSTSLSRKHRTRPRQSRARLMLRKGESPVSARSASYQPASNEVSHTPAVHFHLNQRTPHHEGREHLPNYRGDIYMGHASASNSQWQQHFNVDRGTLTVRQPGLYYVYAQICYNNTHDQNGFIVFRNSEPFLQCLNTVPTNMTLKVHTCHTSGLIHLKDDDTIHVRDIHQDRNVVLRHTNNRSYFGIIKI